MPKIRVVRSYYNDREGNMPTGAVREVSDKRAASLAKRGLAVVIDAPAEKAKRGKSPTAAKKPAGSPTGGKKQPSSSRRGQAPKDGDSKNGSGDGKNENGGGSGS